MHLEAGSVKQKSNVLFNDAASRSQHLASEPCSDANSSGLSRSFNKAQSAPFFLAVGAGLCLLNSPANAADKAGAKGGTVITSTKVPVSIHEFRIEAKPLQLRSAGSDSASPLMVRNAGSRQLVMQPLVSSNFSTKPAASSAGGPRLAQDIPANPPAKPNENPPALEIPVGPAETTTPPGPAAPPAEATTPAEPAAPATPATTEPGTPITGPAAEAATPAPATPAPATPAPGTTPADPNSDFAGRQIAEVRVVGNRVVPQSSILLQVTTQRGAALSSRQLDLDKAKVDALGFFASVEYQITPNLEDPAKVDVTFIVIENRVISGFKFDGATQVKPEDLEKVMKSTKGAVLNSENVNQDVEAIQRLYREKGFAVIVTESRQLEDGTLVFVMQEGKISKIEFSGLKKTNEKLVRRQIRTKAGDAFDQVKIRKDLNSIYDMGFFDDVSYKISDDADKPGSIIITIVVKEKRTGQLSLGIGFDNRSKISGFFSIGENNFRGTGKRVNLGAEVGSRKTFELGYGDPFVGEHNASYDLSIFNRIIYREPRSVAAVTGVDTTFSYEERRTGFRANYTKPLDIDRNKSLLFGFRSERAKLFQTDLSGVNPVPVNLPTTAKGGVTGVSFGFLRDKRDLRLDPSRGGREQFIIEKGLSVLGGSSSFTKVDLDLRRYIPLMRASKPDELPKLVLAGRLVIGRAFGQLPAFEQYFIGGPDTVRGYEVDEQFGDNQYYSNIELRYRLQRKFQIVGFTDIGQSKGGNFSSSNSRVLFSVGAGIRVQTPIGPIRLDVGRGRDGVRTHFAIGPTF